MFQVTFTFENQPDVVVSVPPDSNLLEVAREANVAIDAPCSGNGSCGKCRVKLVSGELECLPTSHITQAEYDEGWRLSCGCKIVSDVTVLVPDIASAYQSRMQTADLSSGKEIAVFEKLQADIQAAGIPQENTFLTCKLRMNPPTLDDTMPDNERLIRALRAETGAERIILPYSVLKKLPNVLRDSDFRVNVTAQREAGLLRICDVRPGWDESPACALAIDIGTTTVAAVLADIQTGKLLAKASSGNGQIRYGADVINRIVEQSKPGGIQRLQDAIVKETLLPIIAGLCAKAGVKANRIVRVCVASNTTMNHLLLGVDAQPVRMEPYIPAFFHVYDLRAADVGLTVNRTADLRLAPNIGSYVGGDISAGVFTTLLWDKDEFSLFVDLGTNGEIVFGNRDFMMTCACSAGPAFEGGDISCGMRATDGAIEAVTIDCATMEPTFTIVGEEGQKPVGLCGSGIIDMIAELFRCGIINAKGLFVREGSRVQRDQHGTGRYILATPAESATGREISLTEVDIESFIRAKGAIYSAIDTLLSSMDMDASVLEHVYVAGGIGSGINMKNAIFIGMFPAVELSKYEYVGNSSLAGAYAMAISDPAAQKVAELARNMTYVELSTHPGYMDNFVAACFLPHTDASRFPDTVQEM